MHGCGKCKNVCAGLLLVLGFLFLLVDLNVWNFWGVSWWSALFLLWGVGGLAKSKCPECKKMCK